jgi:osomolarity two-component system phosphorelay intermediate protein YPD1
MELDPKSFDWGDGLDVETFMQILEMDEPGDCEFSASIVFDFLEQAEQIFEDIKDNLEKKDLEALSSLGHFLKGSSATLGLVKIRDGCESIQQYGKMVNLDGSPEPDREVCLARIQDAFGEVQSAYNDIKPRLTKFYGDKA